MQIETVAPSCFPSRTTSRLAHVEGTPLVIDPQAPTTLTNALTNTATRFPNKGIHFVDAQGKSTFVSYREILQRARRILAGLQREGLKPGSRALLQVDSLEDHFPTFWGCVLGGIVPTTVAIAPTYTQRNGVVDKLANAWQLLDQPVIITTERLKPEVQGLAAIASMPGMRTFSVQQLVRCDAEATPHAVKPDDIAFIQLSSGSTGVPKCIQEKHSSIIAHIHSSAAFNRYSTDDITVNWLPFDHVVPILTFHLKDTYLGCQQVHAPASLVLGEPLRWLDLLDRFRATHTWAPNFGFKLISDQLARVTNRCWDLSSVRFFMNAGEQVTMPVVREFLKATAPFGVRESAMQPAFGMAEVCTCMTYANSFGVMSGARRYAKTSLSGDLQETLSESGDSVEFVSLGTVTPGIAMRIANEKNEALRENQIGRLQIKGPVVTPGYYHNPAANEEAFVGDDWFNTGDLGFIADRELFLTGREKEMIIIRGAKYYCYEVEDVVNSIPGVEPTYAATCGTSDPETGTETLAVFFVPAAAADVKALAQSIRRRVTATLGITPGFVVPLTRETFPKTTSGKIQRTHLKKALEAGSFAEVLKPLEEATTVSAIPAANSVQAAVARIWEEVLNRANLPATAHIFEVGGDSLKATRIASRIREQWRIDFPLHRLFGEEGTISGMAAWIAAHQSKEPDADAPPPIHPAPRTAILPLSYSQLRLWLADQIDPGTSLYNIGRAFRLKGSLDVPAVEAALRQIVQRHEILRTVYAMDSIPVQAVLPEMQVPLPRHDLSHLPEPEQSRVISNLMSIEISRPFDLAGGPLMRAKLVRLGEDHHLLLLAWHQIVTDAWSLGVFNQEFASLYSDITAGRESTLPELGVQYADYATWQQRWLADAALESQSAFWKTKFASVPQPLSLGAPRSGPDDAAADSEVLEIVLQGSLLQQLRRCNASNNVTSFITLQTIYRVLLAQCSGAADFVVGSPESGRRRFETEPLLGCFVNMLPLRSRIEPNDSWRSLLDRVRSTTADAFANADVPFEKVQALAARSGGERARLLQAWFGPIDSLEQVTMGGVQVTVQPVFPPVAQFDLSCFIAEQPERISLFLEYKVAVFTRDEARALADCFQKLLREMLDNPNAPIARHIANQASAARCGLSAECNS
ncbi:MAG TPA: condensation domain-containing protein [Verrucomicrobiae bacterium]|nr:condensation domain-containing protein [Verrucomicrobiae bacterium]